MGEIYDLSTDALAGNRKEALNAGSTNAGGAGNQQYCEGAANV